MFWQFLRELWETVFHDFKVFLTGLITTFARKLFRLLTELITYRLAFRRSSSPGPERSPVQTFPEPVIGAPASIPSNATVRAHARCFPLSRPALRQVTEVTAGQLGVATRSVTGDRPPRAPLCHGAPKSWGSHSAYPWRDDVGRVQFKRFNPHAHARGHSNEDAGNCHSREGSIDARQTARFARP